jgi:modulator of FtsH protease HflK
MSTIVALELETRPVEGEPHPIAPANAPAPSRSNRRRFAAALACAWLLSGFYFVAPDQQAVETMFGRVFAPRVMPGAHYALPGPIAAVTKLKVLQLQRVVVGGNPADIVLGRTTPLESQFFTGDQNIINLRVVAQYSVSAPVDYLFQSANPPQLVSAAVESEMARRVGRRAVDAVLTTEKAALQEEVRTAAQRLLDTYRCGIRISTVNIESAAPPPEAADAFRDVASARADASRIVSDAQGYANDLIPRARGEARQTTEEAEAYRQRRADEATGEAARFDLVLQEYARSPQVTRRRLYLETMEQILPRIKKLIVDPKGNLDLTIVRRGAELAPEGKARP